MFASVVLCDFQKPFTLADPRLSASRRRSGPEKQHSRSFTCVALLCVVDTASECSTTFPNPCSLFATVFCPCPM